MYIGTDIETGEKVAIKIADGREHRREALVYKALASEGNQAHPFILFTSLDWIPVMVCDVEQILCTYLILELLGPSLQNHFSGRSRRLYFWLNN